mgnify:CR=1 FL=1
MDKKKLEKFRSELIKLKKELEMDIEGLSQTANSKDSNLSHYPDDPSYLSGEEYEKTKSIHIMNLDRSILELVDSAIEKIENGGFGLCDECGKKISKGRLNSKPWAKYCLACREKLEKEGRIQ